jgi:phosphatidylglycerol:prolipoprotein diacylglycerol transferase
MGLSWGFGYFFTIDLFEKKVLDIQKLKWLFIGLFISSWVGAKLFFLWFSSGPKIYQYLYANYFWLGGGFVFYGGLIFGLIYYLIHTYVLKKFNPKHSYLLIPGLVFGHAIGRVGCFLTGCCYGSISNNTFGIAINGETRYPVQAYEALALFFLGMAIMNMIKRNVSSSKIIYTYLISYSTIRFFLEFLRGDEIRGIFWFGLSSSQLVSLLLVILIFLLLAMKKLFHNNLTNV